MKRSRFCLFLSVVALCGAILAVLLRTYILKNCMDASGYLYAGSSALLALMIFSCTEALVMLLLCLRLNPLPGDNDCFSGHPVYTALGMVSALLLMAGCVLRLSQGGAALARLPKLLGLLGILAGLGMILTALLRRQMGDKGVWPGLLAVLFGLGNLIYLFSGWSRDPLVIDFAPQLFAAIFGLLSLVMLAGFPLKVGRRRGTVCCGFLAGIFTAMSLPDFVLRGDKAPLSDLLVWLGIALWAVIGALQMLRPAVQEQTASAAEASAPSEEAADELA